ncbi:MAG: hypothetical protein ACYC3I_13790 [Gemmataceae bacterium]
MQLRPRISFFWLALGVVLPACGLAGAGDWPRFRGPKGTGIADDKEVPIKWTDQNVLWKTPLPGIGHSSQIVCKGRIFFQSASRDGKEQLGVLDALLRHLLQLCLIHRAAPPPCTDPANTDRGLAAF